MLRFEMLDSAYFEEQLGFIPAFFSTLDERPARVQINQNYAHGGGWHPMKGWTVDPKTKAISYPGDPALHPIARATLRDETIYVYPHAFVMIIQPDFTYEIARVD